jgi:hypothetical protein
LLPAPVGFLLWLLRMEATYSSEMSRFLWTTGRYIPDNRTFQTYWRKICFWKTTETIFKCWQMQGNLYFMVLIKHQTQFRQCKVT